MKNLLILLLLVLTQSATAQDLISSELLSKYNAVELLFQFGIPADHGVKVYKILYATPDVQGIQDTASGILVLPDLEAILPMVVYHHGTTSPKENVPSRQSFIIAELYFAGKGYATTSADFLGLGDSKGFHPYLHAASQASASINLIRAAQSFCVSQNIELSDQLFITGYSQGGHAAMATFRALETTHNQEFTVTAAAPMSGPYNLTGTLINSILTDEPYLFPNYFVYTLKGLQTAYGNLYTDLLEVFKPEYAELVAQFNNESDYDLYALNEDMLGLLDSLNGSAIPRFLFQEEVIEAIENDDRSNPILAALYDNNLFDWRPKAPTRLYYCEADEQVPYENAIFTDSLMNANGANHVSAVSMGENLNHGACAVPAILDAENFFSSFLAVSSTRSANEPYAVVYPNPVADELSIETVAPPLSIEVYNELGQLVKQSSGTKLSTRQLPNGIYFLKLQLENALLVHKFFVQH